MYLNWRANWCLAGVATFSIVAGVTALASDFLTEGVDNARTGWVRDEKVFTTANVGSTKLLWKVKLESTPRAMHNLFAPLVAERVTTAQGTRELAVVAGVSDDLFGIDVATGKQIWHRHFDSTLANPGGTNDTLCPGGQTAVPTMAQTSPGKYTVYAVSWDGRLRQVNLADGQDVAPPEKFIPGGGKPYALNLHDGVIYTATAQGCGGLTNAFYSFDLASRRASAFIPAGGGLWGRRGAAIDPEGTGLPRHRRRAVRSADPTPRQRHRRREARREQAAAARRLLRRAERELAVAARSRRQHDAGRVRLPQDASSSSARARSAGCGCSIATRSAARIIGRRCTPRRSSATTRRRSTRRGIWGALSAWQDAERHAVGAGAVLGTGEQRSSRRRSSTRGRPAAASPRSSSSSARASGSSTPAWLSRDMDLAEEAVIANGIVFAYAAGEDATQVVPDKAWDEPGGPVYGGGLSSGPARRIPTSRRAALYALDGQTGKELWSSGNQIESWNHFSGLTVANGRAYIATFDGVLYCFGIAR